MAKWPGFVGGTDLAATVSGSAADTVNWYVERLPDGAANTAALVPTPGFIPWGPPLDAGRGGARALAFVAFTRLFAVIGSRLVEFDFTATGTDRGDVGDDGAPAQIVQNSVLGGQLGIVSAGSVYCFNLYTNTLTGPHLTGGYTHLGYSTSRGLALNPTTGKVSLSALLDFATWDAGTFFQRSLFADPWQCLFVDQNNLVWLIGTDSFETWYNTGQGTQPFAPLSGLNGLVGIVGPWAFSVAQVGNVWLAKNANGLGLLVETTGGPPTTISSRGLAAALTTYSHVSDRGLVDTELLTHQFDAHVFTALTVPQTGTTWVYDHLEAGWHRRGQWHPETGQYGVWAPRVHAVAFGQHIVGMRGSGQLAAMDPLYPLEIDGTPMRRLRRPPALVNEKKRAPIDQLEILMDVGLGPSTAEGPPPELLLRVSDDGGRTWGNSLRASTGAAGAWGTRVYWTRLGSLQHAAIELTYSDPAPCRLVDAYVNNLEPG
jgi:hypothetical protein